MNASHMNASQRKRLSTHAINILIEVMQDVLQEATNTNAGGLAATDVGRKAGIPGNGNTRRISRYLLQQMLISGA